MPNPVDPPLTSSVRDILGNLGGGLFDLVTWINSPGKYKPPLSPAEMPWRAAGHQFTLQDLGVIPFFEGLLLEASGEDDLLSRWAVVSANPLQFFPLENASGWRANRGLTNPPQFGIAQGANVLIVDSTGRPISRRNFYDSCWPLLQAVVTARKQQGPVDWANLASDLFTDKTPEWPNSANPRSSAFITQFVGDLLYAMLGMRNPVDPPMQYALLVELGEHRRAGNARQPADAQQAVNSLRKLLTQLQAAPPPAAPPPVHIIAVGSPPHDKP
jgi:hypothetical protein